MKPCSKTNRKHLAWLAIGILDAARTQSVRAHLETCEGCRSYLAELSTVNQSLAAVELRANIQTCESFHQRVVQKLSVEPSLSIWNILADRITSWRIALPATGVAACLALLAILWRPHVRSHNDALSSKGPSASPFKADLPPTFANYQTVANQSLEEFDELLSKQANRNPAATTTYTASRMEE